ncbi:MAG: SPASM domain-containing protein [Candidatus Sulfotelmatobacter sp.]
MLVRIQNAEGARAETPDTWEQDFRIFDTEFGHHLFMVNGSRVYSVPEELIAALSTIEGAKEEIFASYGLTAAPYIDDEPLRDPPVRAISLAIAQSCNLGCAYCYAQQGTFGGTAKAMDRGAALGAIDLLLADAGPGDHVQVTYLGGEPLANRGLLRESADYAVVLAASKGVAVRFSITTNATLLTAEDGEFFERHGFAVTVSLDGDAGTHDRLRPFKDGRGSYQRTMSRVQPLLQRQQRMQVSARVTVTPQNLELRKTLDTFIRMGFHSVGFSPMLSSPDGTQEMGSTDLREMLRQMIDCGTEFERRVLQGDRYPFLNMLNAVREIHKGTHRPYPCGAGAGYLGVSADGGLYACHRFVGDEAGRMGDLGGGIDRDKRNRWLAERHVHFQSPCRECWARYLCGGGCHHEVLQRGRPACDYIRGWLEYCLQAYIRLLEKRPEYFSS